MQHIPRDMTAEEIRALVGDAPLMLEVGSHEGSHTRLFLAAMPGIRLFCFEPYPPPIARFNDLIGVDERVTLIEKAVADSDERLPFYASTGPAGDRADWDFSGSLREPTGHYQRSPEIGFKDPELVPCCRLDTWLAEEPWIRTAQWPSHPVTIDFIWADVQGGQRGLIAGGHRALSITRYLYIECHSEPLYDGEPTHDELIDELNGTVSFEPLAVYANDNILFRNRTLV